VTNHGHIVAQADATRGAGITPYIQPAPPLNDTLDVSSLDVAGYDLVAIGSQRTKGQDLDNNLVSEGTDPDTQPSTGKHRTGYLTLGQERNPWVQANAYGTNAAYAERPYSDSIPDYFVIHLSSGLDKKITNEISAN